ncbi:DUF742 domain-containing protein [Streptomyces albus subsp. chlorinus]|uniref:DUF742 domain-containing protein n=1 Tax=Streptomyces albus TaxID=1888 RepID=UPI0015705862|nr:DUF742 domain-containing protein [Streptomyces albus]NSC21815.1 DUF742 domain-containing protein [Streptomyces albus subsp. chlorinus]
MTTPEEQEPVDTGLVRPYVITNGREPPEDDRFSMITLVTVSDEEPPRLLDPEMRKLWDLCSGGFLSVAEVAGHLRLPVGVVRVLLTDLAEQGRLITRAAPPPAELVDREILEEVLYGLQARFG